MPTLIIGEVRRRTDASASSRRLYENPGRTLVEGELRLLVNSIKRCASGDFAEVSGRGGSGGGAAGRGPVGAFGGSNRAGGLHGGGSNLGGGDQQRPGSGNRNGGGGEISWGDIGNGGDNDPAISANRLNNLKIDGSNNNGGNSGGNVRAEKLLAGDVKEKRLLDYVTGTNDALAIRAGTPRTPPSRPASSRSQPSRPGSVASDGAFSQSSAASMISNPAAAVEHLSGGRSINVFDVDKIAAPLRELLAEERAALLDDVEYLQSCLEDEAEMSNRLEAPPPDIHELKDYSAKLSKVWTEERERAEHIVKVEKMLGQPPLAKGRVGKLRTLTATLSEGAPAEAGAGGGGLSPRGGRNTPDDDGGMQRGGGSGGGGGGVPPAPKPPGPPPRGGRSARSIAASAR